MVVVMVVLLWQYDDCGGDCGGRSGGGSGGDSFK